MQLLQMFCKTGCMNKEIWWNFVVVEGTGLKRVYEARPQDSSEAHSWLSQLGGLPPSACENPLALVVPVGDWMGTCNCKGGAFPRPLPHDKFTSYLISEIHVLRGGKLLWHLLSLFGLWSFPNKENHC